MKSKLPESWALWLFLLICVSSLLVIAKVYQSPAQASPLLQATVVCSPQSTPTPVASCPSGNPAPVLGRQPQPTEMLSSFIAAGLNRLGNNGPILPQIWRGDGAQAQQVSPYAPCILLEAIAYTESIGWKQFNAPHGECGFTLVGVDPTPIPPPTPTPPNPGTCGYGVMQITSGMSGGGGFEPSRVVAEYPYGIGTGAKVLLDKWNALRLGGGAGFPGGPYIVGGRSPEVVEDWYYAVWAYNGFAWSNNPNHPNFAQHRGETWQCGADPTQSRANFPYQELIWGCATNPPGNDYWQSIQLSLPTDNEVFTDDQLPPPPILSRPLPSHGSCTANYLPLILKSPSPTPTPQSGCYEGRPLVDDSFEGGGPDGPFTGNGTDLVHPFPWERDNQATATPPYIPFPAIPIKIGIGGGQDGIQFGGVNDNQAPPLDRNDGYDQRMSKQILLPAKTEKFMVELRVKLETNEDTPNPATPNVPENDVFYFDVRKELTVGNNTSAQFRCSNRTCNRTSQPNQVEVDWFVVTPQYNFTQTLTADKPFYIGVWANVNVGSVGFDKSVSSFAVDYIKITITGCGP